MTLFKLINESEFYWNTLLTLKTFDSSNNVRVVNFHQT